MKHEESYHKEWCTCDRCGKEIRDIDTGKIFSRFWQKINKNYKLSEFRMTSFERRGYISDSELITPEVVSVEITEGYLENRKTIHMCGKCRKEFARFMRNETEVSN